MKIASCLAVLISVLAFPGIAAADSFTPPTLLTAKSPNGVHRVTVVPTWLSCAPKEVGCQAATRAVIERAYGPFLDATGTIKLVNQHAPGQVLISDDGLRIVTIDDYASVGHGPNVIVIYRLDGSIVRRMALRDFLPEAYINGLPRTASSLGWAGTHAIRPGEHKADIGVFLVDASGNFDRTRFLPLEVDLDTGVIAKPSGPAWERAMLCARGAAWNVPNDGALRLREKYLKRCRAVK